MEWPPSMPMSMAYLCSRRAASMSAVEVESLISLGCLAASMRTESMSSRVRRAKHPLQRIGLDPDGHEGCAEVAFVDGVEVDLAAVEGSEKSKCSSRRRCGVPSWVSTGFERVL